MNPTSTMNATTALAIIYDSVERLNSGDWLPPHDRVHIAIATMRLLAALTDEYGPEYFTDDEIELIADTTLICIHAIGLDQDQFDNPVE